MACNLLGRYVHQNGAAAADLGLGIRKGERAAGDSGVELGVFFLFSLLNGGRFRSDLCENFFVSVGEILSQICVYVWNFGRFVLELEAGFSNLGFQLSDLSMSFFCLGFR
jgi:hypothetical protein